MLSLWFGKVDVMGIFGKVGGWDGWMGGNLNLGFSCSSGYGSPAGDLATWRIEPLHPLIAQEATMRCTDFVLSRSFFEDGNVDYSIKVRFLFVRMDL